MKKVFLTLFCLLLSNCSHTRPDFVYYGDNFEKNQKFVIRNVSIKLQDRTIWPFSKAKIDKFSTKEEIESLTKETIVDYLESRKISSGEDAENNIECDIEISYDRMFMMFTNYVYIGTAMKNYSIYIYKDNQLIASRINKNRKTSKLGFSQEFKKFTKAITFSYDKEGEKNEIKFFAKEIADGLEDFNHENER